jgi:hypothetical protein
VGPALRYPPWSTLGVAGLYLGVTVAGWDRFARLQVLSEAAAFTALVRDLPTRLGAFAVRGDVDRDEWPDLFAGTGVTAVENSTTFDLVKLGPLITLSNVPRDWAVGLTTLPWGGHLFVSRGVGMERKNAPRLRFLCRPEIAILELG